MNNRQKAEVALAGSLPPLMTLEEVAAYYRVPPRTLYSWRAAGKGPKARRIGKHLRYMREDVVSAWPETA